MRPTAKKITSLLFVGILLASMAYVFFFQLQQQSIQHKMRVQLESKMLRSVILYQNNIHWITEGKEISIDGRLFDVKSVTYKEDGSTVVTGLYDDEETQLVQLLEKNQKENNSEGNKQVAQFFQFQLSMPEYAISNDLRVNEPNLWPTPANHSILASAVKDILTPPPQA